MSTFAQHLSAALADASLTVETYRVLKARALSLALGGGCRTPTEAVRWIFLPSRTAELRAFQRLAEARLRARRITRA